MHRIAALTALATLAGCAALPITPFSLMPSPTSAPDHSTPNAHTEIRAVYVQGNRGSSVEHAQAPLFAIAEDERYTHLAFGPYGDEPMAQISNRIYPPGRAAHGNLNDLVATFDCDFSNPAARFSPAAVYVQLELLNDDPRGPDYREWVRTDFVVRGVCSKLTDDAIDSLVGKTDVPEMVELGNRAYEQGNYERAFMIRHHLAEQNFEVRSTDSTISPDRSQELHRMHGWKLDSYEPAMLIKMADAAASQGEKDKAHFFRSHAVKQMVTEQQRLLSDMYAEGRGTEPDPELAAYWDAQRKEAGHFTDAELEEQRQEEERRQQAEIAEAHAVETARIKAEQEAKEARRQAIESSPEYRRKKAEQEVDTCRHVMAQARAGIEYEQRAGEISGYVNATQLNYLGSLIAGCETVIQRCGIDSLSSR